MIRDHFKDVQGLLTKSRKPKHRSIDIQEE
jgi:hypothetical protein